MRQTRGTTATIACVSLVLAVLLVGAGGALGQEGAILRVGMGTDANTFDPHNFRSGYDLLLDDLVFDTLVGIDTAMKLYPRLATAWKAIDGRTWQFTLRRGVKFHDGTDFNAEAVRVNFDRAVKALKSQTYYSVIEKITVLDEATIQFTLQRPFAPFLSNLAMPVGGLISPAALQRYGAAEIVRNPVGTGPFRLKEWIPQDRIVLVRNEQYWGRKPEVQQVVFRPLTEEGTRLLSLVGGESDVVINPPAHLINSFRRNSQYRVILEPQARTLWLGFNLGDPVLKDRRIRLAVASAVNRAVLVNQVLEGMVRDASSGVIPPEVLATGFSGAPGYNPELARRLLREGGYANGLRLKLWAPEGRYFGDRRIAETIQQQLKAVGIEAELRVWEYGAYVSALFRHEQQLWIIGWGFTPHPDAMFRATLHSKGEANWTVYSNPQFDQAIDRATGILDAGEMARAYRGIQKIVIQDDVTLIPIYYANNIFVVRRAVQNFKPHPLELLDLSSTRIVR